MAVYTPSPGSWRAMMLAMLAIVALFTIIIAWRTKTTFAWVTAAAAVLSVIVSYFDLGQRELGERRE